ncbi:MAG: hypothetical protein A3C36_00510 [Omnitrophica WOR_2 bacterium RIFCSPHIGHO2_02_FULL_52_10]|nr:MAG: hypothetical protein A3C36_00510 [Omnitrophica WOR_2 bacterium RIFCSPHIGHO2_02_FULL_52_10]
MLKESRYGVICLGLCLMLSPVFAALALAGSEDLKATKREKFQDDSVATMQEQVTRRAEEQEEYQKKMLENSEKTVQLLERILVMLNEFKEEKQ